MDDQARVADSTDEARLLAEQAREKLGQGRVAIEDTIAIFSDLTDLVVQLGDRMAGFADAMVQVQKVSSSIEGIANKTNMLALNRSEEHTSELQSLMRLSYAVFCLKKKNTNT